ncbi:MAG: polysaccharide pyruvyl transferase family protein [Actinobacteria bacterium]|nr:polysaccharide pyruvyl transferase family protein [Actinomycetota bacterium]
MTDTPPTIVFLGTHGQHNIGDELLLETFLYQLGCTPSYVVNTYDPEFTARQLEGRYRAELIDTAGDRLALLRHLWGADAVVFGGGSIVKELYASIGRNRYATLVMILAIVTFSKWVARTPIAMLNIGVGPIETRTGRLLAGLILRQADLVTVRDPGSYALCREVGLGDTVHSGTDAVFSVTPDWLLDGAATPRPAADGPLRIALNLNVDIENPDNWEYFQEHLATALAGVANGRPIELHGLPMQSKGKERDDATVLRAFAARVPGITYVEHHPVTHVDVARLIEACDLVVSERLHAIVIAAILGTPAFVLAYDVKVRELATMLGLDAASVDINTAFDAADVQRRMERLLDDPEAAGRRLHQRAQRLCERAQSDLATSRVWVLEHAA